MSRGGYLSCGRARGGGSAAPLRERERGKGEGRRTASSFCRSSTLRKRDSRARSTARSRTAGTWTGERRRMRVRRADAEAHSRRSRMSSGSSSAASERAVHEALVKADDGLWRERRTHERELDPSRRRWARAHSPRPAAARRSRPRPSRPSRPRPTAWPRCACAHAASRELRVSRCRARARKENERERPTHLPLLGPHALLLLAPRLGAPPAAQVDEAARERAVDDDVDERNEAAAGREAAQAGDERLAAEAERGVPGRERRRVTRDDELQEGNASGVSAAEGRARGRGKVLTVDEWSP